MFPPADTQQQAVYDAELLTYLAYENDATEAKQLTAEQMQQLADLAAAEAGVDPVTITIDHEAQQPCYVYPEDRIVMCEDSYYHRTLIVTHEIAHHIDACRACDLGEDHEAHGPEFCRTWLDLVERHIGARCAAHLERSMRDHNVNISPADQREPLAAR